MKLTQNKYPAYKGRSAYCFNIYLNMDEVSLLGNWADTSPGFETILLEIKK